MPGSCPKTPARARSRPRLLGTARDGFQQREAISGAFGVAFGQSRPKAGSRPKTPARARNSLKLLGNCSRRLAAARDRFHA
eukprot:4675009-Alexandrium_andersonii.AAC.1